MHSSGNQNSIMLFALAIVVVSTILSVPLLPERYAYSQSSNTNSTIKAASSGVDLIKYSSLAFGCKDWQQI